MKVSIYDIAKAAGVSPAAVSMALNGKKGVSDQTRFQIFRLAREMGYQPRRKHDVPGSQPIRNIFLCISAMQYDYFNSSFYFDIIKYLSRRLPDESYNLMIRLSTLAQDAELIQNIAETRDVSAYIFMGTRLSPQFIRQLVGEDVPVIFFNKPNAEGKNVYSVSFDNHRAMYLLTKHAIELGHRDIVYLGYVPGAIPAETRLAGYRAAMEESGLTVRAENIIEAEYMPEFGSAYIHRLASLGKTFPSAILCGNDRLAIGVMKALRELNFSIPEDVSVAGIDNVPLSDMLQIPLTTVDVHAEQIGDEMAQLLVRILTGRTGRRHIIVDVSLIRRRSTGPFRETRTASVNKIKY